MPACGFALYIDPVVNLIKPQAPQKAKQGILVRCDRPIPESIRTSFQLAESFRQAGYVAELDFSGRQSDWRWTITVQDKPPPFICTDQTRNQKREVTSIADVLKIVGGST